MSIQSFSFTELLQHYTEWITSNSSQPDRVTLAFSCFEGVLKEINCTKWVKNPVHYLWWSFSVKKTAKSRKLFSQNKSIINFWWGSTIMVIIFLVFLMFDQIFLSLTVKQSVIIINKHGIYELPHEFPNDLKSRILEN